MSFSSEIKTELCEIDDLSPCCYHAQVYGLVLFTHFSEFNLSITTENPNIFELYNKVITEYCNTPLKINSSNRKKLTSYVKSNSDKEKVFEKFGHSLNEGSLRINHANIENECCRSAFLRGVFLACGSVTEPERSYHLEFVVPYKKLTNDLVYIFKDFGFNPKTVMRKGNHIVYFKDSESIEDFLAVIGAHNASLYLMNVKIEKDVKNTVNRRINFEMSNLEKTLDAASVQVEAIEYIEKKVGIKSLPVNLQEIAKLRLENPDASLTEIQRMMSVTLSRSGVNHRLEKIVSIYKEMKEQNG